MEQENSRTRDNLLEEIGALRKKLTEADRRLSQINELKEALDESNTFFHTVFNSIKDSISILDVESFRIVDVNDAFLHDVRMKREDVVGRTCYQITHHRESPCSLPYDFCPLYETVQTVSHVTADHIHYNSAGEQIFVEISTHPILDHDGRVIRVVHIARDITERKKLEQSLMEKSDQLLELNLNLRKKVEEETEKRLKNEELLLQQSRMAAMGEMIGAIAHQWRQPLNSLGIIVQDILDAYKFNELDQDYIQNSVMNAIQQIEFMSGTIDDFKNFMKPSRKSLLFDLRQAVGDVKRLLLRQLENHNIRFEIDFGQSPDDSRDYTITGYPNELKHVLLNILNNARDAILEKREMSCDMAEGLIRLEIRREDEDCVLTIQDSGQGIPQEIMRRIFDQYFTTRSGSGGMGLGLYMCKVIVEEHMKGTISVSSTPEGAKFVIRLPHDAGDQGESSGSGI